MSAYTSIALTILTAFCIVTGQALMSVFARNFPQWTAAPINTLITYILTSAAFYGFLTAYLIGSVIYLFLLRHAPLAQVTMTLLGSMLLLTAAYTLWLGQSLSTLQWLGYALVASGVLLLQTHT